MQHFRQGVIPLPLVVGSLLVLSGCPARHWTEVRTVGDPMREGVYSTTTWDASVESTDSGVVVMLLVEQTEHTRFRRPVTVHEEGRWDKKEAAVKAAIWLGSAALAGYQTSLYADYSDVDPKVAGTVAGVGVAVPGLINLGALLAPTTTRNETTEYETSEMVGSTHPASNMRIVLRRPDGTELATGTADSAGQCIFSVEFDTAAGAPDSVFVEIGGDTDLQRISLAGTATYANFEMQGIWGRTDSSPSQPLEAARALVDKLPDDNPVRDDAVSFRDCLQAWANAGTAPLEADAILQKLEGDYELRGGVSASIVRECSRTSRAAIASNVAEAREMVQEREAREADFYEVFSQENLSAWEASVYARFGFSQEIWPLLQEIVDFHIFVEMGGILSRLNANGRSGTQEKRAVMSVYCPWREQVTAEVGARAYEEAIWYYCQNRLNQNSPFLRNLGIRGSVEPEWCVDALVKPGCW